TLTAGKHTIPLAARSLDGTRATKGDAIVDRIHLSLPNPKAAAASYEAELAELDGARPVYTDARLKREGASGSGAVRLGKGETVTFWVYSAADAESTLRLHTLGGGQATMAVNGREVQRVVPNAPAVAVSLSGGVNKVTVTGAAGGLLIDRLEVKPESGTLAAEVYEAEDATTAGSAEAAAFSLASNGTAVTGIGGDPDNGNTL